MMRLQPFVLAASVLTAMAWTSEPARALSSCATGTPYTFRAGLVDEFASPSDPTSPGPALTAAFPTAAWKDFDDKSSNRFLGHTFTGLPKNILRAELVVRALPHADVPQNDTVYIGLLPPNQFAVSYRFADLQEANGTWDVNDNAATTFTIALGSPFASLLAQMSSSGVLDVLVQDDTAVDFLELRVWTCPPPVVTSGLPHQAIGAAQLAIDAQGHLGVSHLGPAGTDGIKVEIGSTSSLEVGLAGLDSASVGSFLDLHATGAGATLAGSLQRDADAWSFTPDLAALGTPAYEMQVYAGSRLVATLPGTATGKMTFSGPPQAISIGGGSGPGGGPTRGPDSSGRLRCYPGVEKAIYRCNYRQGGSCQDEYSPGNCAKNCIADNGILTTECQPLVFFHFCWNLDQPFWDGTLPRRFFLGDCFSYHPIDPFSPFVSVSQVELSGNTPFTVTGEKVGIAGRLTRVLGSAQLHATDSVLTASGLGAAGGDGLTFDFDRVVDARIAFAPLDPLGVSQDGSFLQANLTGSRNGTPGQPLATLKSTHRVEADFDQLEVAPDFSALGAATHRVEVYDHGQRVASVTAHTGPIQRQDINIVVIWPVALAALPGAGLSLTWPTSGKLVIPGGPTVTGDEVRIFPETSTFITIDNISGLALRAAGLPEFTLTDAQSSSCLLPVLTRQPANVACAAGKPAVFSVAADSANPLSYRWMRDGADLADGSRVTGSTTATLTLSPTILAQTGTYSVAVSNSCGTVVSAPASYQPGVALRSLLLALVDDVSILATRGTLSSAQRDGLSASLLKALAFLHAGNLAAASNRVDVFLGRVTDFVRAGALTAVQGQSLTAAAENVRARFAC